MASRNRGTTAALTGPGAPDTSSDWPRPASALPSLTWTSSARGEWPTGVHWSPGETRTLPPGYPVDEPPPAWIVEASL